MNPNANPAVHGVIDISQTDGTGGVTTHSLDAPTETSCKSFIAGIGSLIGNLAIQCLKQNWVRNVRLVFERSHLNEMIIEIETAKQY